MLCITETAGTKHQNYWDTVKIYPSYTIAMNSSSDADKLAPSDIFEKWLVSLETITKYGKTKYTRIASLEVFFLCHPVSRCVLAINCRHTDGIWCGQWHPNNEDRLARIYYLMRKFWNLSSRTWDGHCLSSWQWLPWTATNMFLKIVLWGLGFDGESPNTWLDYKNNL